MPAKCTRYGKFVEKWKFYWLFLTQNSSLEDSVYLVSHQTLPWFSLLVQINSGSELAVWVYTFNVPKPWPYIWYQKLRQRPGKWNIVTSLKNKQTNKQHKQQIMCVFVGMYGSYIGVWGVCVREGGMDVFEDIYIHVTIWTLHIKWGRHTIKCIWWDLFNCHWWSLKWD